MRTFCPSSTSGLKISNSGRTASCAKHGFGVLRQAPSPPLRGTVAKLSADHAGRKPRDIWKGTLYAGSRGVSADTAIPAIPKTGPDRRTRDLGIALEVLESIRTEEGRSHRGPKATADRPIPISDSFSIGNDPPCTAPRPAHRGSPPAPLRAS